MAAGGFIRKIAPRTTVIHSKQANRQQQVILPVAPIKVDPRWSPSLATRRRSPPRTIGRPPSPWGWPITLCHHVLLPTVYTIDSKVVLGRFIQRWSGELTRIDDVAIPCLLLLLESLPITPPRFLGRYSCSGLYIEAPTPLPDEIAETLIHILLVRIRADSQDVEVE